MKAKSIKSHIITQNDTIEKILDTYFPSIPNNSVIAISTKIISVLEGRFVEKKDTSKKDIILKEADAIFNSDVTSDAIFITLKNKMILPNAGIDESNASSSYLLYPKNPWDSCEKIWLYLSEKHDTTNFGVILTDSTTRMLRKGSTGISIAYCGIKAVRSYIGQYDVFGEPLLSTTMQIVDALAATGVLCMGEGNEQTPFALIESPPHVTYTHKPPCTLEKESGIVSLDDDIFKPLIISK